MVVSSSAPHSETINREEACVRITSRFGDDLELKVNKNADVKELAAEVEAVAGIPRNQLHFRQNGREISSSLQLSEPIEMTYALDGGASFELVTKFPDFCAERCFCYKCAIQDLMNLQKDDWRVATCFCLEDSCGPKDLPHIQWFCLKCDLSPFKFELVTKVPDLIRYQCICYKCGMKTMPDIMKEDFITQVCLCCHSECGFKDMGIEQCFCLKCTLW
mmetsp:Transcript_22793/g.33073  ORF Transcript_22793/g.33073 Transcript_22793/m.33073 type:complete len:218 (-) Transcript_22793:74-727(-)|eukprot:CAMPEP_0113936400 /NCGR_PEP_ID=MMETSP1339-20121228/3327_1 /TAXON_ID=94617 /ORGANISM="Fibrocapsa japonica" /LENGTH=217 /DNA_ID=CAMNT_0000938867 /DNA_START=62 /DNA_END=715 /DNA_ORIENTATION=+ /assembly_acc=CAM_ASM_000762